MNNMNPTTAQEIESLFESMAYDFETAGGRLLKEVVAVSTFEDVGIMVRNRGVVLEMQDGSAFQITIVKTH